MPFHLATAYAAAGDTWEKTDCKKHPVRITGDTFSKEKAECYEYTGREGDQYPWKGVKLVQLTQDDSYLLVLHKRGLFGTYFYPVTEEGMKSIFENISEWTAEFGYKWSEPKPIKSGLIIQVLGKDSIRSGSCFLYSEQSDQKPRGYRLSIFINYCENGEEFLEDDDILRILADLNF